MNDHPLQAAYDNYQLAKSLDVLSRELAPGQVRSERLEGHLITDALEAGAHLQDIANRLGIEPHEALYRHVTATYQKKMAGRLSKPRDLNRDAFRQLQECDTP